MSNVKHRVMNLNKRTYKALSIYCEQNGYTVSRFMTHIINEFVEQKKTMPNYNVNLSYDNAKTYAVGLSDDNHIYLKQIAKSNFTTVTMLVNRILQEKCKELNLYDNVSD